MAKLKQKKEIVDVTTNTLEEKVPKEEVSNLSLIHISEPTRPY